MNHDVQHLKPVYLIEDDPVQRHSMETLLRASGYPTFCFASSEEFLNRPSSDRKPSCILLDFVLRGQDGLSFLKVHRQRVDAMPVIVLTGHADVALAVDFMAAGASTLLVKPFDADELIDYVAQKFNTYRTVSNN
jgi:FixJ family two-component response regulator